MIIDRSSLVQWLKERNLNPGEYQIPTSKRDLVVNMPFGCLVDGADCVRIVMVYLNRYQIRPLETYGARLAE